MSDAAGFRAQFPVFERATYLNAGTEGPVPARAVEAVRARLELDAREGRSGRRYFHDVIDLAVRLRAQYAEVLGGETNDVALTGSTTDGVNTVLSGLDLRPGEEILTSDEEHPGLLAPLARARQCAGITLRIAPFAALPDEVSETTRLVACSHVSWVSGRVLDVERLAASGVPVLLDGAQAIGAIPVDVRTLGCDFYAGSGQKWLCGPEGSGCLYVRPDRLDELLVPWPWYGTLADPADPLDSGPAEGARRLDHGFPPVLRGVWALAGLRSLAEAGWPWVHERAATLAAGLAEGLSAHGLEVAPRGRSTLVAWRCADAAAEVERLAAEGFIVRSIPSVGLVRASVGAWSSEEELDALVSLAAERRG